MSRRIRIINNLINNSEDDISNSTARSSGNRMPAVLRAVEHIIRTGHFADDGEKSFNSFQTEEEKSKIAFLEEQPDCSESLFRLEDHPLLFGQISVVGIENSILFERFEKLFDCNWDKVDRALMALGDYKQREKRSQFQLGSYRYDEAWKTLFHKSSADGFENTKTALIGLLSKYDSFSDETLEGIANSYVKECEKDCSFDWRYYYIKYAAFRPGRYGKAVCEDFNNNPYNITLLYSKSRVSSNAYNPFIKELDLYRNTKLEENGEYLHIFDKHMSVGVEAKRYVLYQFDDYYDNDSYVVLDELDIEGKDVIDFEDRISKCIEWLRNYKKVVEKAKLPTFKSITYSNCALSNTQVLEHVADVLTKPAVNLVIYAYSERIEFSTDYESGVIEL